MENTTLAEFKLTASVLGKSGLGMRLLCAWCHFWGVDAQSPDLLYLLLWPCNIISLQAQWALSPQDCTRNDLRKFSEKGNCPTVLDVFVVINTQLEWRWQAYRSKHSKDQSHEWYFHESILLCDIHRKKIGGCNVCNLSFCNISLMIVITNTIIVQYTCLSTIACA